MVAALAAAITDKAGRDDRAGITRAIATDWAAMPPLAGLRDALDRIDASGADAADRALAAARPLLTDMAWMHAGMKRLIAASAADPLFEPPFRVIASDVQIGLELFAHPLLAITLTVTQIDPLAAVKSEDRGARSIVFGGRRSLLRVVRAGGAVLDLWRGAPADDHFSAATAGPCRPAGALALADGAVIAFDGACDAWTFGASGGDVTLLQAQARCGMAPVLVEHDATSGAFLGAAAADGSAARMQMIAGLLVRMRRRDAVPALADAAARGPFYLRWHMARAAAALDRQAALPLLRAMATTDPHPDLRDAATRTIDQIAA
jgi:hypothetical protein